MSVAERLDKIENALGGVGGKCSECGWPLPAHIEPPGDWLKNIKLNLQPISLDGKPPDPPKPCPTCGRKPISFTLNIGNKPVTFDGDNALEGSGHEC